MSDIKLFQTKGTGIAEVPGSAVQIEKSLQTLFEANLEALLGVRFLATEHSTGPVHGGRIDTLGLDEDGCPVIIEYKRSIDDNVVSQGLFYLDWLLDHKKEFQWLVLERLGEVHAKAVDWSAPRLLCIAGAFTRYDVHAVKQIARNIDLLRYRRFGEDLLLLELVHSPKVAKVSGGARAATASAGSSEAAATGSVDSAEGADPYRYQRIDYRVSQATADIRDLYEALCAFLSGLGDDVQMKELKYYVAFKRIKNFTCVEVYPQTRVVTCFLKIDPTTVALEPGFTRDVRKIGHFGTGDLEITMRTMDDFAKAQPLFRRAYEAA